MGYDKDIKHVPGRKNGDLMLFSLSTCGWCRKTKNLLRELGVEYRYLDVDLLDKQEQDEVMAVVERHNPSGSFPMLLLDGRCIVGFREDEIRGSLANAES